MKLFRNHFFSIPPWSQGGAIGLLALQKTKNLKFVKNYFGLAPATYISHAKAPMLLALSDIFGHIREVFGDREFGTLGGFLKVFELEVPSTLYPSF